jgi:protein required for attachment to host cells
MLVGRDTLIIVVDGARMAMFRNKGNLRKISLELLVQEHRITPATAELENDQRGRPFQKYGTPARCLLGY